MYHCEAGLGFESKAGAGLGWGRALGARLWAILISSFQAQRNAASSGNHHRPPQPSSTVHLRSRGSPSVLGPKSKSGQESEDERELLVPGAHRTSIRRLSSTVEVAAHCLVKGGVGGQLL